MELALKEAARLLSLPEETVYRLARDGELPSYRVQDQYLFNRVDLQEWATAHNVRIAPELYADKPSVRDALERGGVHYQLPGDSREQVLEAVTRLPQVPRSLDRGLLYQLLVSREALASTGIGEGIAIPHPRDPVVVPDAAPVLMLAFLARPVDFHAIDGQPVRVVFTLLSPSIRQHLQMLARLAYALHDAPLRELLHTRAPAEAILARFAALEAPSP